MLDKRIPYKNIIMKMSYDKLAQINEPVLPEGYSFQKIWQH